ncbi:MAG TPA: ribosome biogenesis GTPase Der [Clostridia bacterium]|nr:ribosome biogenesis GTPase Der [Clostridia bacterium]
MMKPLVAIIGRPNVGKSTFFNKISRTRASLVINQPGVTRDRVYADAEWCGYDFTLIDTGGIESKSSDLMWQQIKKQAEIAIDMCDVIVFIVDGKEGLNPGDYDIADYIRKTQKPIVLLVNKVDDMDMTKVYEFYSLNIGEPHPISSEHSLGFGDALDVIVSHFEELKFAEYDSEDRIKIAIVGKPNAGKSSLLNKIIGYERTIVTDIAGTTRDNIDTPFERDGKKYTLIDTAGIRRKAKVTEDLEYFSVVRSISAIRRADVVLIVFDGKEGLTDQDVKICGLAHDAGKPSVIVVNKWDIVDKSPSVTADYTNELLGQLKFMSYLKVSFVSALTGKNIEKLLETVDLVLENSRRIVPTGILNDIIGDAIMINPPPNNKGKKVRISFVRQTQASPPTFLVFTSDPENLHFSYLRYLENQIRDAFYFEGTPIILTLKKQGDN